MSFKSYENNGGNMAEGDYEVILLKAEETTTKSGYPCIQFDFQVRFDIEQKYQKKHIFKKFFRDNDTDEWPLEKIGKLANSLGIPKDTSFELSDLESRCCILHIKPYTNQDGQTFDTIFWSAPTKAGQIGEAPQVEETVNNTASGFVAVEDEELPF